MHGVCTCGRLYLCRASIIDHYSQFQTTRTAATGNCASFAFPQPPPMLLSRPGRRKRLTAFSLLATLCLVAPSMAIWPFPPKRFRGNSLIDAGAMGLSGDGRVIAFGDFNGDQLWVFIPMYQ